MGNAEMNTGGGSHGKAGSLAVIFVYLFVYSYYRAPMLFGKPI